MTWPSGPTTVSPKSPFPLAVGTASGAEKLPCRPRPLTAAPEASTTVEGKLVQLTHTPSGPAEIEGWSPRTPLVEPRSRLGWALEGALLPVCLVGTISATLSRVRPPSVDSAMRMSPFVLSRYVIHRFP